MRSCLPHGDPLISAGANKRLGGDSGLSQDDKLLVAGAPQGQWKVEAKFSTG